MTRQQKRDSKNMEERLRRAGHRRPVTRREFLGRGLIAGSGMMMLPGLLGILGREAYAQLNCGLDDTPQLGAGKIPFLCIDLIGGSNIAGSNIMVGGQGGQLDFLTAEGYAKLGLPADQLPGVTGVNTDLGIAFHPASALLRGILSKTNLATRNATNGCIIPARSENDTDNNPHNPMYGVAKAGAAGELVALIGSDNTNSGGNSDVPVSMFDPTIRPTKVNSRLDSVGLVDTGRLLSVLNNNQADAVRTHEAIEAISRLKAVQLNEQQAVQELVTCGYIRAADTVARFGDVTQLDPNADPLLNPNAPNADPMPIFTAAELTNPEFAKTAAVMKTVINGWAGAGTIEFGGYDYHGSTRAETDGLDFTAGQYIGAALEYAARLGKPLMIYVLSDGSVAPDVNVVEDDGNGVGKFPWIADNAQTSATFFLVYNPNGRPVPRRPTAQQIGYFRPTGNIETTSSPFANNVTQLAEMVVLNYMALHGEEGLFANVLPNAGLVAGNQFDPYIAFNQIV
ncbi:MAG: hypothetical protein ACR2RB_15270 [Gammaproteobacteria bacterium]